MMMNWCLMSSDVIWHIRDKLWPMPKHGSIKATLIDWLIDDRLYSAYSPLSWADSLRSHVVLHEWLLFIARFLNIHRSGELTALAWPVPHGTAAISAQGLCAPCNHVPCHFMQSHIRKVRACLAVTCHLHFWQNDRDLLRATAVTRGWNRYWN